MAGPNENISLKDLLCKIRDERGFLEQTLARLTIEQLLVPGVEGIWSVKDKLAHISNWERSMIRWINNLLHEKKPDTPDPWDIEKMNAEAFERIREIPLKKVLEEFYLSYWDFLFLIQRLSESQLHTEYQDTWPMGSLWIGVAANTHWHYKEHCKNIFKWIEVREKES